MSLQRKDDLMEGVKATNRARNLVKYGVSWRNDCDEYRDGIRDGYKSRSVIEINGKVDT